MTDPAVREIQLNRKQLVFGVISAVGVSVVIFLLGVSVGRGVLTTSAGATAAADHATPGDATGTAPPPSAPESPGATAGSAAPGVPGAGADAPKTAEPPSPPPEVPAAPEATTKSGPPPTHTAANTEPPKAKPDATKVTTPTSAPTQTPAAPAAAATHGEWFVQVDSFRSKQNADGLAAKLKAAGYAAFISTSPAPAALHRVRVGPFADRAEADKTVSRLIKEGYKPSVTR